MSNQFVYKKRKKLRHKKHKKEADRFAQYIISDEYKELFKSSIKTFIRTYNEKNKFDTKED